MKKKKKKPSQKHITYGMQERLTRMKTKAREIIPRVLNKTVNKAHKNY
jgi:hypothetical protein